MQWPRPWSQFHSADQDGERKEDIADDIRTRARKWNPRATLETLERMSKPDLSTLRHVLMDAEIATATGRKLEIQRGE